MGKDCIEIAMAANQAYARGLFVTAASIVMSTNKDMRLSFNILDGGIDATFIQWMTKRLNELRSGVSIRFFKISDTQFEKFPAWRGNKMTYARFLLPELLPAEEFVVYCDVDMCWRADVSGLWRVKDPNYVLMAVKDPFIDTIASHNEWAIKNGLGKRDNNYFCAGMLVMNLELFRTRNVIKKVYDFLERHPDVPFPDQDALNYTVGEETCLVDDKWMKFSCLLGKLDSHACVVIHYVNDAPWVKTTMLTSITDARFVWYWTFAKACGKSILWALRDLYGNISAIAILALAIGARLPICRQILLVVYKLTNRYNALALLSNHAKGFYFICKR